MIQFDSNQQSTNVCMIKYTTDRKDADTISWDAAKLIAGCWFVAKAKLCKNEEKAKPQSIDMNQCVDIFSSDEDE